MRLLFGIAALVLILLFGEAGLRSVVSIATFGVIAHFVWTVYIGIVGGIAYLIYRTIRDWHHRRMMAKWSAGSTPSPADEMGGGTRPRQS